VKDNCSPNSDRAKKFAQIQRELDAFRARAWRARAGDFNLEFRSTPVRDKELTSRLCGPAMKTIQWRRE
jgi:hypothetical protein